MEQKQEKRDLEYFLMWSHGSFLTETYHIQHQNNGSDCGSLFVHLWNLSPRGLTIDFAWDDMVWLKKCTQYHEQ